MSYNPLFINVSCYFLYLFSSLVWKVVCYIPVYLSYCNSNHHTCIFTSLYMVFHTTLLLSSLFKYSRCGRYVSCFGLSTLRNFSKVERSVKKWRVKHWILNVYMRYQQDMMVFPTVSLCFTQCVKATRSDYKFNESLRLAFDFISTPKGCFFVPSQRWHNMLSSTVMILPKVPLLYISVAFIRDQLPSGREAYYIHTLELS